MQRHAGAPDSQQRLTCSIGFLKSLLSYCSAQAIDCGPILQAAGLEPSQLQDADARIPAKAYIDAFLVAEQLSGDEAFGLHRGEAVKAGHYGVVGLLATSASNGMELLEVYCRYQNLVYTVYNVEIQQNPTSITLIVQPKLAPVAASLTMQEAYLSSILTFTRWLVGVRLF